MGILKKLILFCSLLCGIVFAGSAWADDIVPCDADKYCSVTDGSGAVDLKESCFAIDRLFMQDGYSVQVFFDSGQFDTKTKKDRKQAKQDCSECEKCLTSFLEDLKQQKNTVAGFLVLSSTSRVAAGAKTAPADSKCNTTFLEEEYPGSRGGTVEINGSQNGNNVLGCLRAEHIVNKVLPNWATGTNKEHVRWGFESSDGYYTQVFNMGATNDWSFYAKGIGKTGTNTRDSVAERVSSFYIVPKTLSCKQQKGTLEPMKQAIDAFIKKFPDKLSPKSKCRALLGYCKNFGDLDFLTIEQVNDENNCVEELLKIFKEDPVVEEQAPQIVKEVVINWTLLKTVDTEYDYLSILLDNKNLSVWKDAQGKFNKSRFLSDTIAAVVLGTTSGVVTATLVKKNQIKKGFESLQCKIGGYKVADWGDSFMVGMTMR